MRKGVFLNKFGQWLGKLEENRPLIVAGLLILTLSLGVILIFEQVRLNALDQLVGSAQDENLKAAFEAAKTPPPDNSSSAVKETSAESSDKININTADAAALDSLPGIGPTRAKAIIDYRTKNGPFRSVDDLGKVKGIGPATLAKFRDLITVGN